MSGVDWRGVVPGVPAAGHWPPRGGAWHPGSGEGCPKCPDPDPAPSERKTGNSPPETLDTPRGRV